jgi:hypothetical protein
MVLTLSISFSIFLGTQVMHLQPYSVNRFLKMRSDVEVDFKVIVVDASSYRHVDVV